MPSLQGVIAQPQPSDSSDEEGSENDDEDDDDGAEAGGSESCGDDDAEDSDGSSDDEDSPSASASSTTHASLDRASSDGGSRSIDKQRRLLLPGTHIKARNHCNPSLLRATCTLTHASFRSLRARSLAASARFFKAPEWVGTCPRDFQHCNFVTFCEGTALCLKVRLKFSN